MDCEGCEDRQNLIPWPEKAHPPRYGAERPMVHKVYESGHQDCSGYDGADRRSLAQAE